MMQVQEISIKFNEIPSHIELQSCSYETPTSCHAIGIDSNKQVLVHFKMSNIPEAFEKLKHTLQTKITNLNESADSLLKLQQIEAKQAANQIANKYKGLKDQHISDRNTVALLINQRFYALTVAINEVQHAYLEFCELNYATQNIN